ncbi:MAG: hypothetical protein K2I76_03560, partial [Malacoplasma sp.]|nr:hypothetical protein [Malacoplasma sp.]
VSNSFFQIKNNLFKLSHYSLFNSDTFFTEKIKLIDNNMNWFTKGVTNSKNTPIFTGLGSLFGYLIVLYLKNRPLFCYFWYLYSVSFWFLGTLFIICQLLKTKIQFAKIINLIGSVYTSFWLFINVLVISLFFSLPFVNEFKFIYFFTNNTLLLRVAIIFFINIFYINVLGLCLNYFIKDRMHL